MERAVVDHSIAPMSATLYIETTDGSVVVFKSVVSKAKSRIGNRLWTQMESGIVRNSAIPFLPAQGRVL